MMDLGAIWDDGDTGAAAPAALSSAVAPAPASSDAAAAAAAPAPAPASSDAAAAAPAPAVEAAAAPAPAPASSDAVDADADAAPDAAASGDDAEEPRDGNSQKKRKTPVDRAPPAADKKKKSKKESTGLRTDTHINYYWGKDKGKESLKQTYDVPRPPKKGEEAPVVPDIVQMESHHWVVVTIKRDNGNSRTITFEVGDTVCDVWKDEADGSSRRGDLHMIDSIVKDGFSRGPVIRLHKLAYLRDAKHAPHDLKLTSPAGEDYLCLTNVWQVCKHENFPCIRHIPKNSKISILPDVYITQVSRAEATDSSAVEYRYEYYDTTSIVTGRSLESELSDLGYTAPDQLAMYKYELLAAGIVVDEHHKTRLLRPLPGCTNGSAKVAAPAPVAGGSGGKKRRRPKKQEAQSEAEPPSEQPAPKKKKNKKKESAKDDDDEQEAEPAASGDRSMAAAAVDLLRQCVCGIPRGADPTKEQTALIAHASLSILALSSAKH